ncbi:LytR/AlgR family response regulator transcription factor [Aureispira anguillae]|nr:LytTR family DNA-binding domain-containing protein [Aureispira anguillae]
MKTIIVEDERLSRIALENMIKHFCPELAIVGNASSIKEAKGLIESIKPELVFLDIQLSDGISFELLQQVEQYDFKVVFVTAHNEYALQAFEYAAIHYLLKPINPESLREVINRLKKIDIKNYPLGNHLSVLKDLMGNEKTRLAIPTQKEMVFIDIKNLIYCKADANYTELYLNNETIIVASKSLIFFERVLEELYFVRPHNKYLVNITHITKYIRGRGGELELSNGTTISVSVRRKAMLLEKLALFNLGKDKNSF